MTIRKRLQKLTRLTSIFIILAFLQGQLYPKFSSVAHAESLMNFAAPGTTISLSQGFMPVILQGVKVHPENPFQFDFIVDSGSTGLRGDSLKEKSQKIIKYFLSSLTIPEGELWVNLSPAEKDKILTETFGQTEMGRDLLSQDYILKQLTASLLHPENELGEYFWNKVYRKAQNLYGTTDIPINTFNKVWILPDRAEILQQNNTALVVDSHLKVMLEKDYLAHAQATYGEENSLIRDIDDTVKNDFSSEIIRNIVLPELEKEVNEGKNFVELRQIYNSLILATWYKKALKESLLNQIYVDQKKIDGVNVKDANITNKIYEHYLQAYKKGSSPIIKEDYDQATQQVVVRKYFSGGVQWDVEDKAMIVEDPAQLSPDGRAGLDDIQKRSDFFSFVSVLFEKIKNKLPFFNGTSISNHSTELIVVPLLAAVATFPAEVPAIGADSLDLIKQDTKYYYGEQYLRRITERRIDHNLDAMLKEYKKNQGGDLLPSYLSLPTLRGVIKSLRLNNAQSFERLARGLKREFDRQYSQRKRRQISSRQVAKLELEAAKWVMDFLVATTQYDRQGVALNDEKFEALYHLFIGKKTSATVQRFHVCSSISEAAVILLVGEFGMRPEAVKVHAVFEDDQGNKYPDKNGVGHVIIKISTIDGKYYSFDQSSKPMPRPHRTLGKGETLRQITETSKIKTEYKRIFRHYNKMVDLTNQGQNTSKALKILHRDVLLLLRNPALIRKPRLRDAIGSIERTIKVSLEKRKVSEFFNSIMADLKSIDNQAKEAFRRKQWQEAERLFSLFMRKANEQAAFLPLVLKETDVFSDKQGFILTPEDIISNIKERARIAEKNAKIAGKNYEIQQKRKQFRTYKKFEARYNSLASVTVRSSKEISTLLKKMRRLKSEVKAQLINRNLFLEIQEYYEALMNEISEEITLKTQFQKYKILESRLKQLVGGRRISSEQFGEIRKSLKKIKNEARRNMREPKLDRQIKGFYEGLLQDIESVLRQISFTEPDLINEDQPTMLAQSDGALASTVDRAGKDQDWNTGGVDFNNLKVGVRREDAGFNKSTFDISNPKLNILTEFTGLMIYSMDVTPIINFQVIF